MHRPVRPGTPLPFGSLMCLLFAAGCGGTGTEADPTDLPPPAVPGKADEAFSVQGARQWYLIGNDLTPSEDRLELSVAAPAGTGLIDLWIDGHYSGRTRPADGQIAVEADIAGLAPGQHEALLGADEKSPAIAQLHFFRSYPLYVFVTTDWDDPDNSDDKLTRQERLHERHSGLRITHFVGPYTFTDPSVPPERGALLAGWVKGMRDMYGDEIGLHIHPYCSFVETTAVPCRTSPSFGYASGDDTGYTVYLSSYTEEEMAALLARADEIFLASGLGKPTSFRAGGWTVQIPTLKALARGGFLADTSANNWERLEEWEGYPGADLYDWNKEHWATIDETSQPYYPSEDDILSASPPAVPILEVPDNGILVDYVTADEMIEMFHANWQEGGVLERPTAYVTGYHPPNFSESYFDRVDTMLTRVDLFLHSSDAGPVIYATMSEAARVWPPAPQ